MIPKDHHSWRSEAAFIFHFSEMCEMICREKDDLKYDYDYYNEENFEVETMAYNALKCLSDGVTKMNDCFKNDKDLKYLNPGFTTAKSAALFLKCFYKKFEEVKVKEATKTMARPSALDYIYVTFMLAAIASLGSLATFILIKMD